MSDQLLDRVRKLLAKAEDPGVTEAEAESYNTKAAELIARYGIDRAMLAADRAEADEITQLDLALHSPYSMDKAHLASCIAQPLRCHTLMYRQGRTVRSVSVFGFRSDLERVELLFTSLLLQVTSQLARVRPHFGDSLAAYRRTWFAGFSTAVLTRLGDAENRATREHAATTATGRSTELVLRDRNALVQEAFDTRYGDVRHQGRRRLTGTGYGDGYGAGRRANLHTTGLRGGRSALPRG
jgi:hypothetical protein